MRTPPLRPPPPPRPSSPTQCQTPSAPSGAVTAAASPRKWGGGGGADEGGTGPWAEGTPHRRTLSQQKVQGREANRRRHRLTELTTKALRQPPPPRPCSRVRLWGRAGPYTSQACHEGTGPPRPKEFCAIARVHERQSAQKCGKKLGSAVAQKTIGAVLSQERDTKMPVDQPPTDAQQWKCSGMQDAIAER